MNISRQEKNKNSRCRRSSMQFENKKTQIMRLSLDPKNDLPRSMNMFAEKAHRMDLLLERVVHTAKMLDRVKCSSSRLKSNPDHPTRLKSIQHMSLSLIPVKVSRSWLGRRTWTRRWRHFPDGCVDFRLEREFWQSDFYISSITLRQPANRVWRKSNDAVSA